MCVVDNTATGSPQAFSADTAGGALIARQQQQLTNAGNLPGGVGAPSPWATPTPAPAPAGNPASMLPYNSLAGVGGGMPITGNPQGFLDHTGLAPINTQAWPTW